MLTGCSSVEEEKSEADMVTVTISQAETTESTISTTELIEASTEIITETVTQPQTEEASENVYEKQTYREVLETIYYNYKLPLFLDEQILSNDYDIEENDFLIYEHLNDLEMTNNYFENYNVLNPNNKITAPKGVAYCLAVKKH